MMIKGIFTGEIPAKIGAVMLPILPTMDETPMAVLRTSVGYSSALYKYRMAKAAEPPTLPEMEVEYTTTGWDESLCTFVEKVFASTVESESADWSRTSGRSISLRRWNGSSEAWSYYCAQTSQLGPKTSVQLRLLLSHTTYLHPSGK